MESWFVVLCIVWQRTRCVYLNESQTQTSLFSLCDRHEDHEQIPPPSRPPPPPKQLRKIQFLFGRYYKFNDPQVITQI